MPPTCHRPHDSPRRQHRPLPWEKLLKTQVSARPFAASPSLAVPEDVSPVVTHAAASSPRPARKPADHNQHRRTWGEGRSPEGASAGTCPPGSSSADAQRPRPPAGVRTCPVSEGAPAIQRTEAVSPSPAPGKQVQLSGPRWFPPYPRAHVQGPRDLGSPLAPVSSPEEAPALTWNTNSTYICSKVINQDSTRPLRTPRGWTRGGPRFRAAAEPPPWRLWPIPPALAETFPAGLTGCSLPRGQRSLTAPTGPSVGRRRARASTALFQEKLLSYTQ